MQAAAAPAKLACVLAGRDAATKALIKQQATDRSHKCCFSQLR